MMSSSKYFVSLSIFTGLIVRAWYKCEIILQNNEDKVVKTSKNKGFCDLCKLFVIKYLWERVLKGA